MSRPCDCLVVAWFPRDGVGYLDYRYRVQAVLDSYPAAQVISNDQDSRDALGVPAAQFDCIAVDGSGFAAKWRYYRTARREIARRAPRLVLLLNSCLAPLAIGTTARRTVLYWNEHPTHFYPTNYNGQGGPARVLRARFLQWLTYRGARSADCVMPIGEHHREDLLHHGCSSEKVRLVYMGVDDEFSRPEMLPAAAPSVEKRRPLLAVYAGSVHEDRGRDIMLEAVRIANATQNNVHLLIIGATDEQRAYCEAQASRLGVEKSVRVLGRVPGGSVPEYLHQADVGLCLWADRPYWRFNPPTKLFEYMVAGLPVVANNMPTHTAYIKENVTGRICDYDARSLAGVLVSLAAEPQRLAFMRSAVLTAAARYRWSFVEPEFVSALRGI